jgi:hypothetical protein
MRGFRKHLGHTVVVSASGIDVRGTLQGAGGGVIVLDHAQAIDPLSGPVPIDGLMVIPEGSVKYMQVR